MSRPQNHENQLIIHMAGRMTRDIGLQDDHLEKQYSFPINHRSYSRIYCKQLNQLDINSCFLYLVKKNHENPLNQCIIHIRLQKISNLSSTSITDHILASN